MLVSDILKPAAAALPTKKMLQAKLYQAFPRWYQDRARHGDGMKEAKLPDDPIRGKAPSKLQFPFRLMISQSDAMATGNVYVCKR